MIFEKIILGITLAAPIGPVSLEIIRRGLTNGFLAAFFVCIGAILGDGLCLGGAYLGLGMLTEKVILMNLLGLFGALFLLYLGFTHLKDRHKVFDFNKASVDKAGLFKSILLGFGLAVINPLSLVFWVSIYAATTANMEQFSFWPNTLILVGVLIWSLTLSSFLALSKNVLNQNFIKTIITVSSCMLLFFGIKYGYVALANLIH